MVRFVSVLALNLAVPWSTVIQHSNLIGIVRWVLHWTSKWIGPSTFQGTIFTGAWNFTRLVRHLAAHYTPRAGGLFWGWTVDKILVNTRFLFIICDPNKTSNCVNLICFNISSCETSIRLFIGINEWMNEWMNGWMVRWMEEWMDEISETAAVNCSLNTKYWPRQSESRYENRKPLWHQSFSIKIYITLFTLILELPKYSDVL